MPQITPRTSLVGAVLVAVSTVLLTPAATQAASAPRPSLQTQIRTELTAALLNTIGSDRTGKTPFTVLITTPSPTTIVITSDGFGHIGLKLLTQGMPALEGFVDYTDNGSMYETSPLASTPTLAAALLELGQTGVHWVKFNADSGEMMTKPYVSGGSYISKMSNYCKGCPYDPKKRVGEDACPFTTLYWNFLIEHRPEFSTNHRMAQQLAGIDRLSDVPELQVRARQVLDGIDRGEI